MSASTLSRRYFRCQFCGMEAVVLPASGIVAHSEPECPAYEALCTAVERLELGDIAGSLTVDGGAARIWLEGGRAS